MDSPTDVKPSDPFYTQAVLLTKVIERLLQQKGRLYLSAKPQIRKVAIIEFMKRMRVWGLEKFQGTTYISTVIFYKDEKKLKKDEALGVLVIYIEEEYVNYLLDRMEYPIEDAYDTEALMDACGTLANLIAAKFKSGLVQIGLKDLAMSHFSSYRDQILNGVPYDRHQKSKYEISFEIKGVKRLVADLTLGPLDIQ